MDYINILKDLSTYPGVSGQEDKLSGYIAKLFEKYCDSVEIDEFYNVIGIKKGIGGSGGRRIMVTAHLDEIGLMVKSIDEKGFITVSNIGGVDSKVLLAQEVVIHGKKEIYGIIGAKPPHLLTPEEIKKAVKMEDLVIDTGLSAEEVRKYVSVGDIVTFKVEPLVLQNNRFSSKSLDNRAGVVALLDIMENLTLLNHKDDAWFVATVQEEVGLRGANIAAYNINPDLAIVIDVCHGQIPGTPKESVFPVGKGPAVAVGPNLHRKYTKKMIELAKEENIPYQIDVEPGDTGTEAWAVQVSREGIPTLLVSIPLKYMHTVIETLSIDDIKNTGRLIARFISMTGNEMEEGLC
ncbi:MAG: M42 family metallopeptidase [Hungateiclostridium thermocellum]|nr:M42 family metallopeptidase [Acetivibrio thermocellus]